MKTLFPEKWFEDKNFPDAKFFDESQGLYILRKRMEINRGMRLDAEWQHLETAMGYVAGKGESDNQLGIWFSRRLPTDYCVGGNFVAPCEFVPLSKIFSLSDLENDIPYFSKK